MNSSDNKYSLDPKFINSINAPLTAANTMGGLYIPHEEIAISKTFGDALNDDRFQDTEFLCGGNLQHRRLARFHAQLQSDPEGITKLINDKATDALKHLIDTDNSGKCSVEEMQQFDKIWGNFYNQDNGSDDISNLYALTKGAIIPKYIKPYSHNLTRKDVLGKTIISNDDFSILNKCSITNSISNNDHIDKMLLELFDTDSNNIVDHSEYEAGIEKCKNFLSEVENKMKTDNETPYDTEQLMKDKAKFLTKLAETKFPEFKHTDFYIPSCETSQHKTSESVNIDKNVTEDVKQQDNSHTKEEILEFLRFRRYDKQKSNNESVNIDKNITEDVKQQDNNHYAPEEILDEHLRQQNNDNQTNEKILGLLKKYDKYDMDKKECNNDPSENTLPHQQHQPENESPDGHNDGQTDRNNLLNPQENPNGPDNGNELTCNNNSSENNLSTPAQQIDVPMDGPC